MLVIAPEGYKLGSEIAKALWPTMLFIVVMSLLILWGAHWWTSSLSKVNSTISFWIWFLCSIGAMIYGVWAFIKDTSIRLERTKVKSE